MVAGKLMELAGEWARLDEYHIAIVSQRGMTRQWELGRRGRFLTTSARIRSGVLVGEFLGIHFDAHAFLRAGNFLEGAHVVLGALSRWVV